MNRHLQKRIRKIEECLYTREALASAKKAVAIEERSGEQPASNGNLPAALYIDGNTQ
jgi:hypothetical protein